MTIFQSFPAKVLQYSTFLAIVVGIFFNAFLVWQILEQWNEYELAPERVKAQQLRFNDSQHQKLLLNLQAYNKPTAIPKLNSPKFQNDTGE